MTTEIKIIESLGSAYWFGEEGKDIITAPLTSEGSIDIANAGELDYGEAESLGYLDTIIDTLGVKVWGGDFVSTERHARYSFFRSQWSELQEEFCNKSGHEAIEDLIMSDDYSELSNSEGAYIIGQAYMLRDYAEVFTPDEAELSTLRELCGFLDGREL